MSTNWEMLIGSVLEPSQLGLERACTGPAWLSSCELGELWTARAGPWAAHHTMTHRSRSGGTGRSVAWVVSLLIFISPGVKFLFDARYTCDLKRAAAARRKPRSIVSSGAGSATLPR
jgi:hypothetical protein